MKRTKMQWLCGALALVTVLGLAGCGAASPAPAAAESAQITVSASGTVRLKPDKATVSFGVTTQEPTAELAQEKNAESVERVIAVLTDSGVEEKSIRTTNYSMYPQYDYSEGGERRVIGYAVYTTLSVEDQDAETLGKLISACVSAGINNIDSITFQCSGYDEAYRQALARAVDASREKASALAAAAGKKLGDVLTVTEGWQDTSARYEKTMDAAVFSAAGARADAGPSLQPGETEIRANVTVTFRMD